MTHGAKPGIGLSCTSTSALLSMANTPTAPLSCCCPFLPNHKQVQPEYKSHPRLNDAKSATYTQKNMIFIIGNGRIYSYDDSERASHFRIDIFFD